MILFWQNSRLFESYSLLSQYQLDIISIPLNDGYVIESKADLENNPYWTTYFNVVRAEESWAEGELREVGCVDKAQDFLVNNVTDDEVELFEPKIIMAVDEETGGT